VATTTKAQKPYILEADPKQILEWNAEEGANARTELGELDELGASIADEEVGLVQFPVLTPRADGTMRLVAGFRRTTAAVDQCLDSMFFVVRPEWADIPHAVLVAMIKENTQRKAFTVKEEADAWAQLMLFEGMTVERAAKQSGRKRDYIKGQLSLAKVSGDKAVAMANEGRLSPEIAAALNEFGDQPKIQERILRKVGEYTNTGRWGGEHIAEEERRKRDAKRTAAQRMQELRLAGATVLGKKPKNFGEGSREVDVKDLRDGEGSSLDGDKLVFQPGFAALLDSNGGYAKVRVVCLDPETHGYTRPRNSRFVTDAESAQRARAEQAASERAEAIAAAQQVRRRFLAEVYGNTKSKLAKAALAGALRQSAHNPGRLSFYDQAEKDLVTQIAGIDPATMTPTTSADKVNRILIARYITAKEDALADALKSGRKNPDAVTWLDQLVADAEYPLSDIEREQRAKLLGEAVAVRPSRESPDDDTKPCARCGVEPGEECDEDCDLWDEADDTADSPVAAEDASGE
jgi:ParB/RepB/Spo0J family partition protein